MDSVTFANLSDADSSEGRRMLVKKEEVARSRWLREEMALKTWGLEKLSKGVKKVMGRKEDVDSISLYLKFFFFHSVTDPGNCIWHRK